jgi:hypothetical protein
MRFSGSALSSNAASTFRASAFRRPSDEPLYRDVRLGFLELHPEGAALEEAPGPRPTDAEKAVATVFQVVDSPAVVVKVGLVEGLARLVDPARVIDVIHTTKPIVRTAACECVRETKGLSFAP